MPFYSLENLPTEIKEEIIKYLEPRETARLAELNHHWKSFTDHSSFWKKESTRLIQPPFQFSVESEQPEKTVYQIIRTNIREHAVQFHDFLDAERLEQYEYEPAYVMIRDTVGEIPLTSLVGPWRVVTVLEELLQATPYPDGINHEYSFGLTLLHWFAAYGHPEAINFLLAKGAEIKKNDDDDTPLDVALTACNKHSFPAHEQIIRSLVAHKPEIITNEVLINFSLRCFETKLYQLKLTKLLCELGIDIGNLPPKDKALTEFRLAELEKLEVNKNQAGDQPPPTRARY